MPELPEVETTRRGIEPYLTGKRVHQLIVRDSRLRWPIPADLAALIQGQTIRSVERRGKYLQLKFDSGTLLVHLGMSGSIRVLINTGSAPDKHDHVDLVMEGGARIRYNDPRRFGAWLWQPRDEGHMLLDSLGPEPLTEDFDSDYLFARSRKKKQPIKLFIMDSKVVVGVGNIYANEALFRSGIRPTLPAGKVSRARMSLLVDAIKTVLAEAINQGGTTLNDFTGADGKPGYFVQKLSVYGRTGKPCLQCGALLKEIRLANRSTVYCSQCQTR